MADNRDWRNASTFSAGGDSPDNLIWTFGLVSTTAPAAAIQQVVFIDGDVPDARLLAAGVAPGVRAVILNPSLNGIQQIAAWLTSHGIQNLAGIDIVAHGADGVLDLSNSPLDSATIGQYQSELATIGAALRPGGAIQLYGCDVAQDAAGDAFLQQLSQAAGGASVAASSSLVGAADEGGSWTLNVNVGTVTAGDPFTAATQAAYPDVLPVSAATDKIIFDAFNENNANDDTGNRVEQISAQGSAFVSGSTVDFASGGQTGDTALGNGTDLDITAGFAVDTALNEYFVAVDDMTTHALTIQKGTTVAAGSLSPTPLYSNPLQDLTGSGSTLATWGQFALDVLHGELYYAQAASDDNGNPIAAATGIYKININSGSPTLVTSSSNTLFNPQYVALDVPDNLVFFTDAIATSVTGDNFPSVNNLDVANLNTGSAVTVLKSFTSQNSDPNFMLQGLAVDTTNHVIYLATLDYVDNTSTNNAILKIAYTPSGSGGSATASIGSVTTLYSGSGADQPQDISLDVADGIFYVTGRQFVNSTTFYGAVYEGSLSGGSSLTEVESMLSVVGGTPAITDQLPQLNVLTSPTVTASGSVTAISGVGSVTADSGATVTEQDGQLLTGATVSGIVAGDTLSFNGGSSKSFSDGFTIASSFSGGSLTLSGNASAADYQSALDAVAFSTTSSSATARTLAWAVKDAEFTSATSNSTVNVHVPPTVTASGAVTFNGGGAAVTLDSGLTVGDASSTTLVSATVVDSGFVTGDTLTVGTLGGLGSAYTNGTLTLTASPTASLATFQTALDSVQFGFTAGGDPTGGGSHTSRTIDWTVNDGTLASNTGTSTLNVVHTAPTITAGATATFTGGGAAVVLDSGVAVSDVDSGGVLSTATVTVASAIAGDTLNFTNTNSTTEGNVSFVSESNGVLKLTSSGSTATIAQWQTALAAVTYSFSPSNGDPTKNNSDTSRTIDWLVNDGNTSNGASSTSTSTLNTVHVGPTVAAGASVNYVAEHTGVVLDTGLTASDLDSGGNLIGATIKISTGFATGDTLNFTAQNGISESSFSNGTLTLTGTATVANYQSALASITYSSSSADPAVNNTDTSRTISWLVNDGAASSSAVTSTVNVDTPPSVTSIDTVQASSNSGGTEQFIVAFSEPVTGVTTSAFTLAETGTFSGGSISSVSSSIGSSITVTVTSVAGSGTLGLDLNSSGTGIKDAAGNGPTAGFTSGQTYSISTVTAPAVTESLFKDTGTSSSDNITSNDELTGGGDDGATVTLTEGVNTLGTATANGSGTWTFTPSPALAQGSNTVVASETNSGGTGSATLTFTYDTIAPAVTESLVNDTGSSNFDNITSNDELTGGGDDGATVTLTEGVNTLGTAKANGSGTWTFTPSPALAQGSNTVVASETDTAGNTGSATLTFTYDTVAPTVSSIDTIGSSSNTGGTEQFTVGFSESVTGVDTSDFTLAETGTFSAGSISSVSSSSGSSITVTVTGVSGNGTLGLDLKSSGTGIQDIAGNAISGGFTGGETFTITPGSGTPSTSAPSTATVGVGQAGSLGTITIAETPTTGGETFTLVVSDSAGTLAANNGGLGGGGTITPSNSNKTLTISNATLTQVNADLMTLTDAEPTTAGDTVTYNLSDSNGGTASPASTTVTVNGLPTISAPGSATVAQNVATSPGTITVGETGNTTTSGETFTVVVSDGAGVLSANTGASGGGGTITPSNANMTLTISGATLAQVNADLTTLLDDDASTSSDTITVHATDSFGNSDASDASIPVTVTAAVTTAIFDAHVYTDTNGDGSQDGGETGLPGVTVNLLDGSGNPTGQSLTTDASGDVSFTGLAPGSYEIAVVAPAGDAVSQAINLNTPNTLTAGQTANATEGVYVPATFSVHVYDDVNADGTQDTGDTNASGITVNLLDGSGAPTGKSTTTDASGNASFTGLAPGSYEIGVVTPAGGAVSQSINLNTSNLLASGGSASATEGYYAPPALSQPTIDLTDAEGQSLGNIWSTLIANGVDPVPASLTITTVGTSGTQGFVSLNSGTDSLTYQATGLNPSEPVDSFTYTLKDGSGGTVTGTVDVTITGPNLPTTVVTTPGATGTATGSGQRLISEGTGQTLMGSPAGGDELFGGPDTTIDAAGNNNAIYAEPGNHAINMGASNNTATLGDGNNSITATGTGNTVTAGNGNNIVSGMSGGATITLGNGNDTVTISGANNKVTVGTGTDHVTITGTGGNDTIIAGDGTNTISAGGANDSFTVGNGKNTISAAGASATVVGGNGGDTVAASAAGDNITTGSGNDTIIVTAGSATIKAGLGINSITFKGSGNDVINQGGTDTLTDNGTNNTIALPLAGQGMDTTNGSVLANGDTFDLRAAMAATTWDQQNSDLGSYLSMGTSGSNALVQLSVTSGGTPITIAVLNGQGSVSLSTFVSHALFT